MRRTTLLLAVLAILLASGSQASTLSTLISSNGTITEGDLVFSDFTFRATPDNPGDVFSPTTASGVTVQGTTLGGNDGLLFTGPFTASGLGPIGFPNGAEYLIQFEVTLQESGSDFTGIHQALGGTLSPTAFSDLFSEGLSPLNPVINIGDASSSVSQADPSVIDSGLLALPSADEIHLDVDEDFDIGSGGASGSVNIPNYTIAFSQTGSASGPVSSTPEPSTIWVLGAGLLALAAVRARMNRSEEQNSRVP